MFVIHFYHDPKHLQISCTFHRKNIESIKQTLRHTKNQIFNDLAHRTTVWWKECHSTKTHYSDWVITIFLIFTTNFKIFGKTRSGLIDQSFYWNRKLVKLRFIAKIQGAKISIKMSALSSLFTLSGLITNNTWWALYQTELWP